MAPGIRVQPAAVAKRDGNAEGSAEIRPRRSGIGLRQLDEAHDQVALPLAVAGVPGGQRFADGEALAVGGERPLAVALGAEHVADPVVAD
jgi:hypothetical protein